MLECEGCGVCAELCPAGAVQMAPCSSGDLLLYRSPEHVFSTARLKMGSGASGKLVTEVKRQLGKEVPDAELAIVDGSPGIGCPVIASVSGASLVLIVAEPTLSGFHDLKRILETGKQFGVIIVVCINKFDINTENTKEMERFCHEQGIPIAGKIPFDKTVVEVSKQGKCITCYSESPAGKAIVSLWKYLKFYLT